MRSVLILGGTEQISEKLAQFCASDGDTVTFVVPASYVNYHSPAAVKFLKIDRHSEDQMKSALQGQHFDVVFDCSAAAPQTLNLLLSTITTDRFIFVSSFEAYAHYCQGKNKSEADLPLNVKEYEEVVKVGSKAWYARGKYQAELLLANKYKNLNYAIVRVPFMMSLDDDYDNALGSRLLKYVEAVVRQKPVIGKRFDAEFNFAENNDTAKFLLYLAGIPFSGVVNFASEGHISMQDVIGYIEQKTGKKAIYATEGEAFPFTVHPELTMELSRCASLLYTPLQLKDWLYQKLDNYIAFTSPVQRQPRIEKSKVQNWLVTGGSTGVGRTMVLRLMQLGYTVAATSRDVSKLNELPDSVVKIQLDVTNPASCRQAVQTAIEKMGRVDVLVNNAGLSHTSSFEETPDEVGNAIIETNYWGVSNMMKAIIPYMRQQKNGTIINISSASGFRPRNFGSYYVASKFAADSITRSVKFEGQRFMRVMSVNLGGLNTGLMQRQTVVRTQIDEYKKLPQLYPHKKGYSNRLNKTIDAIIRVANYRELPRNLILGWDAYQQFPQAMQRFEQETEMYRPISITTDAAKKDKITLPAVVLPRNRNLKIQNWLITGASGGFGKILALRLRRLGYTVTVTSRKLSNLDSMPDSIHKIESQLDSPEECRNVIQQAIAKMGSVDVLVNNATTNCWCSYEECPEDIMRNVFYVNFNIPANMIKAVLPHMRENGNGTVINISSIAGIQPRARVSTYSAAKAALEGLTRTLKSECQRFARFMAVEPVYMMTGIMAHNPVMNTKISEYKDLGRYTQEVEGIPNRKDIAAQQLINIVNREELPQCYLIGTESYLVAKNEIERAMTEYEKYKTETLSACEKTPAPKK